MQILNYQCYWIRQYCFRQVLLYTNATPFFHTLITNIVCSFGPKFCSRPISPLNFKISPVWEPKPTLVPTSNHSPSPHDIYTLIYETLINMQLVYLRWIRLELKLCLLPSRCWSSWRCSRLLVHKRSWTCCFWTCDENILKLLQCCS